MPATALSAHSGSKHTGFRLWMEAWPRLGCADSRGSTPNQKSGLCQGSIAGRSAVKPEKTRLVLFCLAASFFFRHSACFFFCLLCQEIIKLSLLLTDRSATSLSFSFSFYIQHYLSVFFYIIPLQYLLLFMFCLYSTHSFVSTIVLLVIAHMCMFVCFALPHSYIRIYTQQSLSLSSLTPSNHLERPHLTKSM